MSAPRPTSNLGISLSAASLQGLYQQLSYCQYIISVQRCTQAASPR